MESLLDGGYIQTDDGGYPLDDFDGIHASPPCQAWSQLSQCVPGTAEKYSRLVAPIRELLIKTGLPYVIENVPGAPLIDPVMLCGTSFDLRMRRHRLFESNFSIPAPECDHASITYSMSTYGVGVRAKMRQEFGYGRPLNRIWADYMGVPWMNDRELSESIPPAFTEHIGFAMVTHIEKAMTRYRAQYAQMRRELTEWMAA